MTVAPFISYAGGRLMTKYHNFVDLVKGAPTKKDIEFTHRYVKGEWNSTIMSATDYEVVILVELIDSPTFLYYLAYNHPASVKLFRVKK